MMPSHVVFKSSDEEDKEEEPVKVKKSKKEKKKKEKKMEEEEQAEPRKEKQEKEEKDCEGSAEKKHEKDRRRDDEQRDRSGGEWRKRDFDDNRRDEQRKHDRDRRADRSANAGREFGGNSGREFGGGHRDGGDRKFGGGAGSRDGDRGGWKGNRDRRGGGGGGDWRQGGGREGGGWKGGDRRRDRDREEDTDPNRPAWATGRVREHAEELKQRKLLWQKRSEDGGNAASTSQEVGASAEKVVAKNSALWSSALSAACGSDASQADKFKRLMGIKSKPAEAEGAAAPESGDGVKLDEKALAAERARQEALRATLDRQYEVARESTHMAKGRGLGFHGF